MDKIEILGKEYPYIISASAAKKYFGSMSDNMTEADMVDFGISLIYNGIRDGNLSRGFIRRVFWFLFLPSKKMVGRGLSVNDISDVTKSLFPEEKSESKKKA